MASAVPVTACAAQLTNQRGDKQHVGILAGFGTLYGCLRELSFTDYVFRAEGNEQENSVEAAVRELPTSLDYVRTLCDFEIVIMGDMNVNYRERHTRAFEMLKEFERVYNLHQSVKEPTRITVKSKITIDLIWTYMTNDI